MRKFGAPLGAPFLILHGDLLQFCSIAADTSGILLLTDPMPVGVSFGENLMTGNA